MELKFNADGLIPAIVQDADTNQVLMMAWMNREAFDETLATRRTCFYSRSRQKLWRKGEESGNVQEVLAIAYDCDADTLLVRVRPAGPACHTGAVSCFFNPILEDASLPRGTAILDALRAVIAHRKANPKEGSYTNYLFDKGVDKICKKVGEEAAESIIAAKNNSVEELTYEASDMLYHLLVLLENQGVPNQAIWDELAKRHK